MSWISSAVNAALNGGIVLSPSLTCNMTVARSVAAVRGTPPALPSPVGPWQTAHAVSYSVVPFAISGVRLAIAVNSGAELQTATSSSDPPSENSQTLSPRVEPANRFPAE